MRRMEADRSVIAQLRRGAAEYCLLALLGDRERYGLELVRTLGDADLVAGEGTVYPLLSRLSREGYVTTTWRDSPSGPPRKYYALTGEGRAALGRFTAEWRRFRDTVDNLVSEGSRA
jgi:PadR family transcriptional regulator, regulatory protein PadR